jgi:propanol-preferring alcohol dehydrogenase
MNSTGQRMQAMVLRELKTPLALEERAVPEPAPDDIMLRVEACAICRTDLHVIDHDLPNPALPLIPGHEIVGRIEALGAKVAGFKIGQRVGVPWLGRACGHCGYCASGRENLCDTPQFTGYSKDGGFATHTLAHHNFVLPLSDTSDPVSLAPLLCAGLIGWRSLRAAEPAQAIGLYGFGAAAHIIAQVCAWQGRQVYAFTRPNDRAAQKHALALGAVWAGGADEPAPVPLDSAIIFAPVGALIPAALQNVRKGGKVVCGGIHMTDIPSFAYRLLWEERHLLSVANLTRQDGLEFLAMAAKAAVKTHTTTYPLAHANQALDDLRHGRLVGAAVLVMDGDR